MEPSQICITVNMQVTEQDFVSVQRRYLVRKMWWLPIGTAVFFYLSPVVTGSRLRSDWQWAG